MFIPTVAVRLYRPVALALESRGVAAGPFFAEFGMPDPAVTGWDVRLPLPQIAGVWGRLLEVTQDPEFALHAAQHVDLTVCDVITYLEGNARTVGEALRKKFEYLPLITNAIEWTLDVSEGEAAITLHERPARPPLAPVAEFLLGTRQVFFQRFGPEDWGLRAAYFRHEAPARIGTHTELFGVPPRFEAAQDQLVFDARLLEAPMRQRDDALSDILTRYADLVMKSLTPAETQTQRVEHVLRAGIDPGIAQVAQQLGVAARTLQRSLQLEGTTYAEIAARMRRAAAERLLSRRELAISELAGALGFNDAPAFHHAFVRWTGTTPGEFRRQALGANYAEVGQGRLRAHPNRS
ncbi:MAG TPA: AraC family transcriptional regulator [Polyangiaceae bacterium]|nr:AraC family transcriptional regulator [Polyangiaceae bacterium]